MAGRTANLLNWSRARGAALGPGLRAGGSRAVWSTLDQMAAPASQLVLTPLLLHRLGPAQFGLWVLALSALWSAPLLTRGMEIALLSCAPRARGDGWVLQTLVVVPLRALVSSLPLAVAAAALVAWLLSTSLELSAAAALTMVATLLVLATAVDAVMAGALKGVDRFGASAAMEAIGRTLSVVGVTLLVPAGSGAVLAVAVLALFVALKAALKTSAVMRARGGVGPVARAVPVPQIERELRRIGAWSLLTVSGGIALYAYDRWVVAAIAGASVVGHYAICSQYAQFSLALLSAAALPLIPWAARQREHLGEITTRRRLAAVAAAVSVLTLAASAVALLLGPTALSLWIGPQFAADNAVLVLRLGLVTSLLALAIPASYILIGLGHTRRVGTVTALAAAVLVLATVLAAPTTELEVANYKFAYAAVSLTLMVQLLALLRNPQRWVPAQ